MTKWETFRLVAGALRPMLGRPAPTLPDLRSSWEQIVEAASHLLVAPALGWCWADAEWIEEKAAGYFSAALELNTARNRALREGLQAGVEALNGAGIVPLLLKGSAILVERLYPDDGIRMIGDVDLFVREPELQAAEAALRAAGFGPDPRFAPPPPGHRHLAVLSHPDLGVGIELHHRLLPSKLYRLDDPSSAFDRSRPLALGAGSALIPSTTDQAANLIAHAQLIDGNLRRGNPQLRRLLDIAVMATRRHGELDWEDIRSRYRRAGREEAVDRTLAQCGLLFDTPPIGEDERSREKRLLKRALDRPDALKKWIALPTYADAAVREILVRPALLHRLARPASWRRFLARLHAPW